MSNNTTTIFVITALCFASLFVSFPVFAASSSNPSGFTEGLDAVGEIAGDNHLSREEASKPVLQSLVKWFMSLIATFALVSLLYGGFLYITSQGEESQAEKAKTLILYSVIGLIIIGLSAIIVNVVIGVLAPQS